MRSGKLHGEVPQQATPFEETVSGKSPKRAKLKKSPPWGIRLLIAVALLTFANGLHAQTDSGWNLSYWSLDAGVASSDILVEGLSFGLVFDPKISLSPRFMIGSRNVINFSNDNIVALETQAYFRWNFLRLESTDRITNIFLQGGVGLIAAYRGADVRNTRGSVLADATLGVNIPIFDRWHIEPSVRVGYPFIAGAVLTAGIRFPLRQNRTIEYVEVIRTPPPREVIRTIMITLVEYILFGGDTPVFNEGIDADARALNELVIDNVAKVLNENPDFVVRIEGHANPVTRVPEEIQELLTLSEARANEVAGLLKARGVDEEQIVIIAYGGTRILATDHDHWNINRRVEMMVIKGTAE